MLVSEFSKCFLMTISAFIENINLLKIVFKKILNIANNLHFSNRNVLIHLSSCGNCCFPNQQRKAACFFLPKRESTFSVKQKK